MIIETSKPYKKHLFICVNQRDPPRDCCMNVESEERLKEIKEWLLQNKLRDKVWVTKARCLGHCNNVGCTMVLYPERKWMLQVKKEDLEEVKKEIMKDM
ncbi:(2Fe-2S) ferredoxin domain-containing protein [Candidatus Woesearchaeota archaeon]|nr:(2Fe-2S) ferredoxin domain-containing protein [Candidatus Woesearchaeota archaeon]